MPTTIEPGSGPTSPSDRAHAERLTPERIAELRRLYDNWDRNQDDGNAELLLIDALQDDAVALFSAAERDAAPCADEAGRMAEALTLREAEIERLRNDIDEMREMAEVAIEDGGDRWHALYAIKEQALLTNSLVVGSVTSTVLSCSECDRRDEALREARAALETTVAQLVTLGGDPFDEYGDPIQRTVLNVGRDALARINEIMEGRHA